MKIPKGFIKDSEGIYRRGSFVFKNNKIYKEAVSIVPKSTVEDLADNYVTASECIRAILAFPASIGEKPRTTDVYVDKVGNNFKQSNKFSKNTVAIVTSDRNVIEIKAKDISNADDFSDLINKDKADKPVTPKEIKSFSSDKPKDSQEVITGSLKESYSEKLGGDPEDFISDVNDILAHIKTFDTNKLATKLAYEIVEDFEIKCEDLISMTKGRYLNESAEDNQKFWDRVDAGEIKVGDTLDSEGAGDIDILDLNKNADYILINRNKGYEPFVAAWAPEFYNGKLTWGQGHYFDNEEDAREYFKSKLNESEKLNESTKFYDIEDPNTYIELSNGKVTANPAGKVLDKEAFGLVANGNTIYVITSGDNPDTIEAYSIDAGFPYKFKAGK